MTKKQKQKYRCSINYLQQMVMGDRKIESSVDGYEVIKSNFDWDLGNGQELFVAIMLNRSNEVLAYHTISIGGQSATLADPKVVFRAAILHNAAGIIVAHNHPSQNLKPSTEDRRMTAKLFLAGKCLDLPLLDHLIITQNGYFSFADNDMLHAE
jgi:DNA repair protein RadC